MAKDRLVQRWNGRRRVVSNNLQRKAAELETVGGGMVSVSLVFRLLTTSSWWSN